MSEHQMEYISQHVVPIDLSTVDFTNIIDRQTALNHAARACRTASDHRAVLAQMIEDVGATDIDEAIEFITCTIENGFIQIRDDESLPAKVQRLLDALKSAYPRIVPREDLSRRVYGEDVPYHCLGSIVKRLRQFGWKIHTEYGVGFSLESLECETGKGNAIQNTSYLEKVVPLPEPGALSSYEKAGDGGIYLGLLGGELSLDDLTADMDPEQHLTFLYGLHSYFTCKTTTEEDLGPSQAQLLRALLVSYPKGLTSDAIISLLYDNRDIEASNLSLISHSKRLRQKGWKLCYATTRGYFLLDYRRGNGVQPAYHWTSGRLEIIKMEKVRKPK